MLYIHFTKRNVLFLPYFQGLEVDYSIESHAKDHERFINVARYSENSQVGKMAQFAFRPLECLQFFLQCCSVLHFAHEMFQCV